MSQSKKGSLAETLFNTTVGFVINWTANMLILPHYGLAIKPAAAFSMGMIFTVISVVRGYGVRRLFNRPAFAAFIDRSNVYLGDAVTWLKNLPASVTNRARSAGQATTSADTTTGTASASAAVTTKPAKETQPRMTAEYLGPRC